MIMDNLYKLAVKGLMDSGCSVEEFRNLPPGIKEELMPLIINKLQVIDDKQREINKLQDSVSALTTKVSLLENLVSDLKYEVDRLRSHYMSNLEPPRPRRPHPDIPYPPFLNLENSRRNNNFSFD